MKSLIRSLIVIGSLLSATASFAQPPGFGDGVRMRHPDGPGGGDRFLVKLLDLTEEQQSQWQAFEEEHRTTVQPIFEQLRANREAVEAAIEARDATQIGELVLAGEDLKAQLETELEALESQKVSVLTDAQKGKYESFRAARESGDGPRFGPPWGRGPRG